MNTSPKSSEWLALLLMIFPVLLFSEEPCPENSTYFNVIFEFEENSCSAEQSILKLEFEENSCHADKIVELLWTLPNNSQVTTNDPFIKVTELGKYLVRATYEDDNDYLDSITVVKESLSIASVSDNYGCNTGSPYITTTFKSNFPTENIQYTWYDPSGNSEVGSSSYSAFDEGYYTVEVLNNGCLYTEEIYIIIHETIDASISASVSNGYLCNGQANITITIDNNFERNWYSYDCYISHEGNYYASESYYDDDYDDEFVINVNDPGEYKVEIMSTQSCPTTISFEVFDEADVSIIGGPIQNLPSNSSVTLSTEYSSEYQYEWYKEGNIIPGENTSKVEITSSGIYSLMVSNISGCVTISDPVVVSFSTEEQELLLDNVEIALNETKTLRVNSTHNSYKWSTGETTQQIEVNADDYGIGEHIIWVEATDSSSSYGKKYSGNGSAIITIRDEIKLVVSESLSKNGLELKDEIKLSPIPVKDILKIEIPSQNENVKIEIISSLGKVVIRNTIGNNENLDVSNLPNGTYTVVVYIDNKVYRERIVKL